VHLPRKCQAIIKDLQCMFYLYYYNQGQHFDRAPLVTRLDFITQECSSLIFDETLFASDLLRSQFFSVAHACVISVLSTIDVVQARKRVRALKESELVLARAQRARPTFKADVLAWNQFADAGAPALPVVQSVRPVVWPVHAVLPLEYTQLRATSVQTLPPATSAILTKWTEDYSSVIQFLHEVIDTLRFVWPKALTRYAAPSP